jgi:AcrR family transcriptional regulator
VGRTPDLARRRELLDALVAECAENGVGGRSLRELADAVGTSHRMLLHHFGSREDLLLAVVDDVERRQMELLRELPTDGTFAAMWAHLRRPELRALERLFFECYARGAQGESPFTTMLPAAVDRWLAQVQADADPAAARLGLAVMRGLLLDLAGTDDDAGVDAAAQAFIALLDARSHR